MKMKPNLRTVDDDMWQKRNQTDDVQTKSVIPKLTNSINLQLWRAQFDIYSSVQSIDHSLTKCLWQMNHLYV